MERRWCLFGRSSGGSQGWYIRAQRRIGLHNSLLACEGNHTALDIERVVLYVIFRRATAFFCGGLRDIKSQRGGCFPLVCIEMSDIVHPPGTFFRLTEPGSYSTLRVSARGALPKRSPPTGGYLRGGLHCEPAQLHRPASPICKPVIHRREIAGPCCLQIRESNVCFRGGRNRLALPVADRRPTKWYKSGLHSESDKWCPGSSSLAGRVG